MYEEQLQREYEGQYNLEYNANEHESSSTPNVPSLAPEHWLCDQCSSDATCEKGICVCKDRYTGDGIECTYGCPQGYVWNVDKCDEIDTGLLDENDEGKVT